MENASPPVEGLREEPHCRFRYKPYTLQTLCHARGLRYWSTLALLILMACCGCYRCSGLLLEI